VLSVVVIRWLRKLSKSQQFSRIATCAESNYEPETNSKWACVNDVPLNDLNISLDYQNLN